MSQINAIRNKDGIFINTEVFREEAKHFLKYGYYCPDAWGSPAWIDYWQEQLDRCKNGYSSGGVKITGHHYAYLNFGQIKVSKIFREADNITKEATNALKNGKSKIETGQSSLSAKRTGGLKQITFPDFWSLDYNFFHVVDIARWGITKKELDKLGLEIYILPDALNGGYHLIIAKSRRKGFSYKSSFIAANTYNTIRDSVTIIGAFDIKYLYPEGTMKMASDYLNFFNEHTGWVKARDYVDKINHKKASYSYRTESGIIVEKGYKSQIIAVTFKDNPDAAIGKDGTLVLFEEGGKFNNLKEAYLKTRPAMEDGIYTTGQIIIYGTSGDMDSGTIDFAEMFYSPQAYGLLPFENIWDESAGVNAVSGMFVPDYWNKPGFIDRDGNSDNESAKQYEINKRKKIIKHSVGTRALMDYISQYPFSPEEAFSTASINDFPVIELRKQLAKVRANNLFSKKGQAVVLYKEDGKVKMKPDLKGELNPIAHYPIKDSDTTGAVVIFEAPIENIPFGLYKIGYDPYRQDQSTGVSLGACYVYKSRNKFSYTGDTIVAEYVGRPESAEAFHRNVMLLAELYHCQVMYENEVPDVKTYFKNQHKLHLLASQPDGVISKHIKNSKVNRVYGIHMNTPLKDAGAKYIKKWLLTERDYDEEGNKILNLETIYSPALLEELISFNLKDNFDRCLYPGTKITTINGYKNVEDIKSGDLVLTHKGNFMPVTMVDKHINRRKIYEIHIVGNYENLLVTDNHPIYVAYTTKRTHKYRKEALNNIEFIHAGELTHKYQFALVPKRKLNYISEFTNDELYLLGWYIADGYVNTKTYSIQITFQKNQEHIAKKIAKIIDNLTIGEYHEANNRKYHEAKTRFVYKKGYIRIIKTSRKLAKFLLTHGGIAHNKMVSEYIYNSKNTLSLLVGYLEGDGHQKIKANYDGYKRQIIECSTIYETLIKQIRQMLIDNGIWASIRRIKKRKLMKHEQFSILISGKYVNKIAKYSLKFKVINPINIIEKNNQFETKNGFWTPIKITKTFDYTGYVYNFEVATDNSYVCSGVATHNCMALMQVMFQIEEDNIKEYDSRSRKNKVAQDLFKLFNRKPQTKLAL